MSEPTDVEGPKVRVVCHLRAPAGLTDIAGAVLRLTVEDVSLADASSMVVARAEVAVADAAALDRPVELHATLDPRAAYAVRAQLSRSGEPGVHTGDLVSVSRHTVTPQTGVAEVVVELVEVLPPRS